jgi:hypothetical protein
MTALLFFEIVLLFLFGKNENFDHLNSSHLAFLSVFQPTKLRCENVRYFYYFTVKVLAVCLVKI